MAQSLNYPQIIEVMDPLANQHVVMVLMTTDAPAKFPNKPWGTPLADIGVAAKDAARFADYVLVDFEPNKGSHDLFWIFQKLSGPSWVTRKQSRDNLTPAKYRSQIIVTITETEVVPTEPLTALTGDVVSSEVTPQANTGKALKRDTEEALSVSGSPLLGKQAYVERTVADTSEQLVNDGTPVVGSLTTVSHSVTPLGNGKSIEEKITVPSWPIHLGSDWNPELQAQVQFTEQFVDPPSPADLLEPNTSFRIVNKDRSLKRVEVVPSETLANYRLSYPIRINLRLPKELIAVNVVWNTSTAEGVQDCLWQGYSYGTSWNLNASMTDAANSSSSLNPDVQLQFSAYSGENLIGQAHVFYLPNPVTTASILAALSLITNSQVKTWPVFRTASHTITAQGQSVGVRVNASISASSSGSPSNNSRDAGQTTSEEFSLSTTNNSIQTPQCIHGRIDFTGDLSRTRMLMATANLAVSGANFPSVAAKRTKMMPVVGSVTPAFLPATGSVSRIPTSGMFLTDSKVQVSDWNHSKVYAEVFNATDLA